MQRGGHRGGDGFDQLRRAAEARRVCRAGAAAAGSYYSLSLMLLLLLLLVVVVVASLSLMLVVVLLLVLLFLLFLLFLFVLFCSSCSSCSSCGFCLSHSSCCLKSLILHPHPSPILLPALSLRSSFFLQDQAVAVVQQQQQQQDVEGDRAVVCAHLPRIGACASASPCKSVPLSCRQHCLSLPSTAFPRPFTAFQRQLPDGEGLRLLEAAAAHEPEAAGFAAASTPASATVGVQRLCLSLAFRCGSAVPTALRPLPFVR